MTKIKLCGLMRVCDIEAANAVQPDYIGFVFAPKSKRFVSREQAAVLKERLDSSIQAVGVFVNEDTERIADLLNRHIIDIAQLHGTETAEDIRKLRTLTGKPVIQAFRIASPDDIVKAQQSIADYVLLDAGAGDGIVFDWNLLKGISRPYFLAGGLNAENVGAAVRKLQPFAADVSSGIETDGRKDIDKMAAFAVAVRKEEQE